MVIQDRENVFLMQSLLGRLSDSFHPILQRNTDIEIFGVPPDIRHHCVDGLFHLGLKPLRRQRLPRHGDNMGFDPRDTGSSFWGISTNPGFFQSGGQSLVTDEVVDVRLAQLIGVEVRITQGIVNTENDQHEDGQDDEGQCQEQCNDST